MIERKRTEDAVAFAQCTARTWVVLLAMGDVASDKVDAPGSRGGAAPGNVTRARDYASRQCRK